MQITYQIKDLYLDHIKKLLDIKTIENSILKMGKRFENTSSKKIWWDFPGGPVGKTLHSQYRGPGFDPWWGN